MATTRNPQLNLRCEVGFTDSPASDITAVDWTDVTDYLRLQDGVSLTRGRQDETAQAGPGSASFVLNNRDGRFTPGNTSGAYTPNVKLRRPCRLSVAPDPAVPLLSSATLWLDAQFSTSSQTVPNYGTAGSALNGRLGSGTGADSNDPTFLAYDGTPYVYLPGVAGNYASTPDAAALDITGDIDIRVRVALDDWTPASDQVLLSKFTGGGGQSFLLWIQGSSTGAVQWIWSANGTTNTVVSSTVTNGITDGSAKWIRVTHDVDNGSGGNDVRFYTSDDGASWTQLGATVTTAGTAALYASTTPVEIGTRNGGALSPAAGKFYRAIVKDGIDGTTVLDVDTSVLTSGAATSFTATTGQTVTVNRATSGRKAVAVVGNDWLRGSDDFTEVSDDPLLDFDADDSFMVAWVGRIWATPTSGGTLVAKRTTGQGWALTQTTTTHGATFTVSDGTNSASATSPASSSGALRMYAAVVDRTAQTLTVYCNGVAGTPVSIASVGSLANSEALRIGRLSGASTSYSDAEDTAATVARRALTAAEIAAVNDYYSTRTADPTYTTPYEPVWTGYVGSWGNGWNQGVQPVARVQASDLMARLAIREMRSLMVEEQAYDGPALHYPLDDEAGSTAAGNQSDYNYATLPLTQAGTGGTAVFGTESDMGADPGQGCLVLTRSDASNGLYLTQTYNPLPELAAVSGVTLECFVYLPVSVTGTVRAVELGRFASFDTLAIDLSTNAPQATVTVGATTVTTSAGSAINDGGWHHLAATYDGTNLRLWVDGTNVQTSAAALGTFTGSILTVGAQNNGTTLANGWFMGVAAYGSALSSTRIAAHAAARNGATGETSLARFNRIVRLAVGSWAESSSAETPTATMGVQSFAGNSAAALLYQVQDAELAPVFIGADGVPRWQARGERTATAATASLAATMVDSSTGFELTDQMVVNTATYSRPGGARVTVVDSTSVDAYGEMPDSRTLYVDTDAQVDSAANYVVNSRSEPQVRTGSLTTDLTTTDPTVNARTLLTLDVGDVLEVTSVPLGSITTVEVFVEGVNDVITPTGWRRTWNTSPLRAGGQVWILGDATYSVLGSTTILGG